MVELVQSERDILIGSLRGPNFAIQTAKRWTADDEISPICVLEKIFKKKHFGVK